MGKCYFVTATDTDAGKTLVCAAWLRAAADHGLKGLAIKPVAAGCTLMAQGLQNQDAIELLAQMAPQLSYDQVNPVALQPAIAPHLAAVQAGVSIRSSELADHCRLIMQLGSDLCLIEGAGGWRVPLNNSESWVDLVRQLDIPVIVVVAVRLGCINHALLTVEGILRDGVKLAGWVANSVESSMPALKGNLDALKERIEAPLLGTIPYLKYPGAKIAAKHLDLSLLL